MELVEERITVRHGDAWLDLERDGALIRWSRQDGRAGILEMTEAGQLRTNEGEHEEEMDIAAESWARELMA